MRIQLAYRCRFCRQEIAQDSMLMAGLGREELNLCLLNTATREIAHECTASGSHVGLCDLVGAVVIEEKGADG
jgi:hypothetical protein